MSESFFYGRRRSFATYWAATGVERSRLLVICPALFDEYRRCYRVLSDFAQACAAQGWHVLRIDYSGTGESFGELGSLSVADWIDDIESAIDEGQALCGAHDVTLFGVRAGATLASQVRHAAVTREIRWDALPRGADVLAGQAAMSQRLHRKLRALARRSNQQAAADPCELFELGPALTEGLNALVLQHHPQRRIFSVSGDQPADEAGHAQQLEGYRYDWPAYHNGNFYPKPLMRHFTEHLA